MVTRIEIGTRPGMTDSRGEAVARRVRDHLHVAIAAVRTRDVFHVEPALPAEDAARVAEAFAGPVLRQGAVGRLDDGPFDVFVSVGYRPGVTDPVGKSARVAIEDLLGRSLGAAAQVYSSRMYLLTGVDVETGRRVASEMLANEVIERISVSSFDAWLASEPDLDVPRVIAAPVPAVESIDLQRPDDELSRMSREKLLALSVAELRAIRDHFRKAADEPRRKAAGLGGAPTDVELECLAQTWSEHCKHKIINARIEYREPGREPETIGSLFRECIRGTTETVDAAIRAENDGKSWLVSVFHDNAGVIAATDRYHLVYKVETHNSPSALDPYGGAITGIVGVNRDPFGTGIGAELLANVWGYCFAPPATVSVPRGLLHPRRIRDGVHQGVIDGGNQSGVPYGRGWEFFDERFLGKPLVYCGTVGRMPVTVAGRPGHEKEAKAGDRIVMVGGRIGKDGIHGATFSSAELTEESPVQAVQIGDPITQKMMFDFLLEARDLGLYDAITDNGAGGLSSSVGEMAEQPGGASLDLSRAPLKYQGLAPWEILLSEAQERMTLAVPPEKLDAFMELAQRREVEATDLGAFTGDGMFEVLFDGRTVALMPIEFLHDGLPKLEIEAVWSPVPESVPGAPELPASGADGARQFARFLARDNMASQEQRCRRYDHEVKGLTVIKPWTGVHADVPAEAAVFQVDHDGFAGYALAEAVFPRYSDVDAEAMAQAAVDLTVRRLVAAGARPDRIAALDNYCWPDPLPGPDNPDARHKAAQLVRASRGLAASCVAHGVPLISGKDSMKNDAVIAGQRISIPPTLLVSGIALVDDVRRALTPAAGGAGDVLILVGITGEDLGGTERAAERGVTSSRVPRCRPAAWNTRYRKIASLIAEGIVSAAAAPGLGGLAPALFRMARASGAGLDVDLDVLPVRDDVSWDARMYAESCGRMLLACAVEHEAALTAALDGEPFARIGTFIEAPRFVIRHEGREIVDAEVSELAAAWKQPAGGPLPAGPEPVPARSILRRQASAPSARPDVSRVRVLVPVGLGLNCEEETAHAFRALGCRPDLVNLTDLFRGDAGRRLDEYHVLAMIGGFAYGDHVAGGLVLATRIKAHLQANLTAFLARGGLMLGICNGFQALVRLGLLPGPESGPHDFVQRADLAPNDRLGYRNAWVTLGVDEKSKCAWTDGLGVLELPSRHGEGKFLMPSGSALASLERAGQLPLRYLDARGEPTESWPYNPNGSPLGVAGITDRTGRILGLMPHPDAFLHPWHHPHWRHDPQAGAREPDGLSLFARGLAAARESL